MQQQSQQQTIDDMLYLPLSEFLVNDNLDFGEFERFILSNELPDYFPRGSRKKVPEASVIRYKSFLLEAFVKWSLSRFAEETSKPFSPFNQNYGLTRDEKHLFIVNKWGNVSFYDLETGERTAELDALWEFQYDRKTLINFEVTSRESQRRQPIELHIDLITQIDNDESQYCRVRPIIGDEELGLSIFEDYRRKIVIPKISNLNALARKVTNTIYQSK